MKSAVATFGPAALIGFLLVLPFAILESLNADVTRQSAPGLLVLFALLWLLAAAFVVALAPLVRARRGVAARPANLLFRVAFLAFVAATWASIIADQMPCFMGVPNCD